VRRVDRLADASRIASAAFSSVLAARLTASVAALTRPSIQARAFAAASGNAASATVTRPFTNSPKAWISPTIALRAASISACTALLAASMMPFTT
jgi:hypothetical protein